MAKDEVVASGLPRLLTEMEAAAYLGKSVITLRRWRKAGRLGSIKIGRDVRFTEAHLLQFISLGTEPSVHPEKKAAPAKRSKELARRGEGTSAALAAIRALSPPS